MGSSQKRTKNWLSHISCHLLMVLSSGIDHHEHRQGFYEWAEPGDSAAEGISGQE